MTHNIGVCSAGHTFLVDHSLHLTGAFNRVKCPECLKDDRHNFLYDGEKHQHMLTGSLIKGAIGACGNVFSSDFDVASLVENFPDQVFWVWDRQ